MRLLHTSDWHLGQALHTIERHYEHQRFLDWLLDTIEAEQADALLVAGDIFDNANPSSASQKQLYRFLQRASERVPHLNLVVVGGNHDSPGRLEAPGPLLAAHGTRVIGAVQRNADGAPDIESLVLPLTGADGAVHAWCLAVPFLRPGDVPRQPAASGAGADADAAADPYLAGIALLYRQALALALARRQPGQAIVAMGHCHMIDGQMSADSERRIVIGGTEMLPAGIFDPAIAYAALGHLHLAQAVGKQHHIRYSGSPIPLSFAEVGYRHQILRIDLDGEAVREIAPILVPRAVPLLRVPARPAPIAQVLDELAALDLPPVPAEEQPLLEVRVRLDAPEPGLRARIEAALDGKPVRLAKIETSSAARGTAPDAEVMTLDRLEQLKPDDIFRQLYRQRFGNEAPSEQLSAFAELMLP
ncbi:exonuclease SbcD [Duganella sp. Leaf126]|uniref:exonuclease SbcCD subunit D C-terminal domain-containing protein n=1 Tax=Duganella sp. Leaf126 TaxID=1736266 RepID=UPI0006FA932F|nr:exonuclease SbcCD subunit D C-terminal domain-containing protein [Duganella sp. Leaf126]KQQ40016.1 exonuclease SbcD [Duganella sp. Leaf126]